LESVPDGDGRIAHMRQAWEEDRTCYFVVYQNNNGKLGMATDKFSGIKNLKRNVGK
jgi:hypothetical protein